MASDSERPLRSWIRWLIVGIWISTALAVYIATRLHPTTTVNLLLHTRKISFKTNSHELLGQNDAEQLLISGVSSLQIQFMRPQKIKIGDTWVQTTSLEAEGDAFTSCTLYRVRSRGFEVKEPAVITFEIEDISKASAFTLKSHGSLNDSLSSLPDESGLPSGIECIGLQVNGGLANTFEEHFSPDGGDTIFLSTTADTRFDMSMTKLTEIGDTQIPILGEVRLSEILPGASEEKSVLLQPDPEITFEDVNRKVTSNAGDLLIIVPKGGFYLRQFTIKNGIQLSLHGTVRDVRAGAGANDLSTLMPSAFERLNNSGRIFGAIPAIAGLLIGILEKMGVLGKK